MGELAPKIEIVIGNKNYSSWSLRAWLALKATGQPFRETRISLNRPDTKAQILKYSPAGKVPVLLLDGVAVWESIAICASIADNFPAAKLRPADPAAAAMSRSVAAEMHGGFPDMRKELSMDISRRHPTPRLSAAAQADVDRVCAIWREARRRFGQGGDLLFGEFSISDCMYAPVATRFATYGVALDPVCGAYRDAILNWPTMREWIAAAAAETEVLNY
jgi:glutathione S-transferase